MQLVRMGPLLALGGRRGLAAAPWTVWFGLSCSAPRRPEGGRVLRHRGDVGTSSLCPVSCGRKATQPSGAEGPPPHKNVYALCGFCWLKPSS